jgi:arginine N-succinyltransferase
MAAMQDPEPGPDPGAILIRPLVPADASAVLDLARAAGTGLTNLPPDRDALQARIARSIKILEGHGDAGAIMLGIECHGTIRGCGMIFPRVGVEWPFYSYRISHTTQRSSLDRRSVRFPVLTLTNDLEDCAEVGGLIVDPGLRKGGFGRAMARSRYLFMAQHRARFGERVIADLRGYLDGQSSPFWDAVGGRFYDMEFDEADRINGTTGNQFIADLGPRHPIYVNMLSPEAQAAIGRVHDDGRPAQALLVEEGFREEGYVDIFDAGPTMVAPIDRLRAVAGARHGAVAAIGEAPLPDACDSLVATGSDGAFRCTRAAIAVTVDGIVIDRASADRLSVGLGDMLIHTGF